MNRFLYESRVPLSSNRVSTYAPSADQAKLKIERLLGIRVLPPVPVQVEAPIHITN